MMTTKKELKELREQEAKQELLNLMDQYGHTVYTELEHVSRSGMLRRISCHVKDEKGFLNDITPLVSEVTGYNEDKNKPGLRVTGCGMDMGFSVVYNLSNKLYNTEGYTREGAYKISQKWL
jgi:hypothetical protein